MGTTSDRNDPGLHDIDMHTGMQRQYLVSSDADDTETVNAYVRPYRTQYRHLTCNTVTVIGHKIAATYARHPFFYETAYCSGCHDHFLVGEDGEFVWLYSDDKVGT